jgi:alpha-beta hydrolase superfamily lysophospholipase
VRELVVAWGKQYPLFGRTAALDLVNCLQWPSGAKPNPPQDLKFNVLLLGGEHDPIVGSEGVSATAAVIINAKAASKRVVWQGIGHGTIVYAPCALAPVTGYLDSGKLPDTDTFCPA